MSRRFGFIAEAIGGLLGSVLLTYLPMFILSFLKLHGRAFVTFLGIWAVVVIVALPPLLFFWKKHRGLAVGSLLWTAFTVLMALGMMVGLVSPV